AALGEPILLGRVVKLNAHRPVAGLDVGHRNARRGAIATAPGHVVLNRLLALRQRRRSERKSQHHHQGGSYLEMFYSHAVESIPCLEPKGEPASIARLDAA